MNISIFTPTHNPKFLLETYNSIKTQPYDEWVVFPNNGVELSAIPHQILADNRTKIINNVVPLSNIGAIKKFICSQCTGDILVELDHDDLLVNEAIEKIIAAFKDPNVIFAYSNSAEFNEDGHTPRMFGSATLESNYDTKYGWSYRDFYYEGILYKEAISPELTPFHASLLLFAPNHFRAFRKSIYDLIGGYNENLAICDDQDLMCRLYPYGKFKHIDECCYLYRVHGENSWLKRNSDIQKTMLDVQRHYIRPMIETWAQRNNLTMLDLGGRFGCPDGYKSVDKKEADICCDLEDKWPFDDSSIGVIRAFDVIEHLKDPIHTMKELHRVLIPGGYAMLEVPSTDGRGAWQDPTHCSYWNQNSFYYYTRQDQAKYIDNTTIRFKSAVLTTHYPSKWEIDNNIPYVRADLICLKDGYRPMGSVEI